MMLRPALVALPPERLDEQLPGDHEGRPGAANLRGYVSTRITRDTLTADYRCVPRVTVPGADVFTRRSYVIEDGVRGLQLAGDNPMPPGSRARRALPGPQQIIEDTIREETGG